MRRVSPEYFVMLTRLLRCASLPCSIFVELERGDNFKKFARRAIGHVLASYHFVDASGEIITIESGGLPWKEQLSSRRRSSG